MHKKKEGRRPASSFLGRSDGLDVTASVLDGIDLVLPDVSPVAEAPWSVAEWAVARGSDSPRATVLVLVLG